MHLAKPLTYITKDIERALGIEPLDNYFIICKKDDYGILQKEKYPNNIFLKDENSTFDLLKHHQTGDILVFKNDRRIEEFCKEKNINIINPKYELSEKIENKLTQIDLFGELKNLFPRHKISKMKDINWEKPFILQWGHSHTGDGTHYIDNKERLEEIKKSFPERVCRIFEYIEGESYTVNIVVGNTIEVGNISYQITGIAPYTKNRFSTIGNDWSYANKNAAIEKIEDIAMKIGEKMRDMNWRGIFGIDCIQTKDKKVYLIEINARQTASTVFESTLQKENTIFENHIKALLNIPLHKNTKINSGAQLIVRENINISYFKNKSEYNIITSNNAGENEERYRIQTKGHIVKSHNELDINN